MAPLGIGALEAMIPTVHSVSDYAGAYSFALYIKQCTSQEVARLLVSAARSITIHKDAETRYDMCLTCTGLGIFHIHEGLEARGLASYLTAYH